VLSDEVSPSAMADHHADHYFGHLPSLSSFPILIWTVMIRSSGADWAIPLHGHFVKEPPTFFTFPHTVLDQFKNLNFDLFSLVNEFIEITIMPSRAYVHHISLILDPILVTFASVFVAMCRITLYGFQLIFSLLVYCSNYSYCFICMIGSRSLCGVIS
jgi:hypothetical protein